MVYEFESFRDKSNVHVTQECLLFSSPQAMLNNMDPVDDTF